MDGFIKMDKNNLKLLEDFEKRHKVIIKDNEESRQYVLEHYDFLDYYRLPYIDYCLQDYEYRNYKIYNDLPNIYINDEYLANVAVEVQILITDNNILQEECDELKKYLELNNYRDSQLNNLNNIIRTLYMEYDEHSKMCQVGRLR